MSKRPEDIRAMRAVSLALRRHMTQAQLTQHDLAERIGVSQSGLSRYISMSSIPRGAVLMRIARELGISPAALVAEAGTGPVLTIAVPVLHRIGEGEPSGATLQLPVAAFIGGLPREVIGIEVLDRSADQRFPPGSVLACERWSGPIELRAVAIVAATPGETRTGPFRIAAAGVLSASGSSRTWWALSTEPGGDGPLPTSEATLWTPAFRPLVAVIPIPETH